MRTSLWKNVLEDSLETYEISDKEESSNMYDVTIGQIYKRSEDWVRMWFSTYQLMEYLNMSALIKFHCFWNRTLLKMCNYRDLYLD